MIYILYKKLKVLCDLKNITVTQLERILQFGNGTIHRWKNTVPSADKLKIVADYFGVTIDYLMSEDFSVTNQEALNVASEYLTLTPTQMGMVKLYISILKSGQPV